MDELLTELARAWHDAGNSPSYHRRWQNKLRHEWPVLYEALRKLPKPPPS